jgi:hypothetical protein
VNSGKALQAVEVIGLNVGRQKKKEAWWHLRMTGHERATSKKTPNVQHPNVEQRSRSLPESSAAGPIERYEKI